MFERHFLYINSCIAAPSVKCSSMFVSAAEDHQSIHPSNFSRLFKVRSQKQKSTGYSRDLFSPVTPGGIPDPSQSTWINNFSESWVWSSVSTKLGRTQKTSNSCSHWISEVLTQSPLLSPATIMMKITFSTRAATIQLTRII